MESECFIEILYSFYNGKFMGYDEYLLVGMGNLWYIFYNECFILML